ncbi:minor tail protein [Mycobacterium phage Kimona]|uniref:Minor tail protein n=1 Tax=Mycobacterium phage Kimona TaxID=2024295 RepID=A0A249XTZ0_9CAUD|nr:minor tail protein [Mycobacterium phage Kimona]ASZ75460.1 minor tail protein [Mycobacterium phage Kimona]
MSVTIESLADADRVWNTIQERKEFRERERRKPPLIRLWNGDMVLRGVVAGERGGDFEFIENDTGTASLELSLDHYLAKWVMNFRGRDKRNVIITIDKQGARWSGFMDHYTVVRKENGDCYLEIVFKHDYEQLKHILVWANPFLRPELQFPKLWLIFGPAKWCLLLTLFVNILRLETSLWTLPDNPLDPTEWMPLSFDITKWRNIVKPFPFLGDNSPLTLVFGRFQNFHDVAKKTLDDAQLTVVCRRYLPDEDPHPFEDLRGELNIGPLEDLLSLIPIRRGCVVWDIVDNSGWGSETTFGGSLLTGLWRAVVNIASDGMTEGVDVFYGDPTFPGEYYEPGFLGTNPHAPWIVFEEGPYTGIKSSEFKYYEATDTSFVGGGSSMPGVNEAISAAINMGGDFLTSFINSQLAALGAVGGAIDLPPLGGMMDAVAKPLYSDVFLAFQEWPTLRATETPFPIPLLEGSDTGLGDFHLYEGWADGAEKAFTLSMFLAIRKKIHDTRAHTAHTIKVSDAAPYYVGEKGYGHFFIGSRVGTTVLGFPIPDMVFVERVTKISYSWGKDGPKGWEFEVGYREPKDPVLKLFELIQTVNGALGTAGIL